MVAISGKPDLEIDNMTYYESAEGVTISKDRAIRELLKHGADVGEFLTDMGDLQTYDAQAVLAWLGY